MRLFFTHLPSPVGKLKLVAGDAGLAAVLWENDRPHRVQLPEPAYGSNDPVLVQASEQLQEYFAGTRKEFDLPLAPVGTPFQQQVWQALRDIPFGETRTYGQLAAQLGNPLASRAVGAANGRNPISIIVPCHRVIGHSGKLTGFAGGLQAKEYLLSHEQSARQQTLALSQV